MTEEKSVRVKFFLPNARMLTASEIAELPPEKIQAVDARRKKGLWLEIACPDDACVGEDGRITIPAEALDATKEKGFLMNIFCPEDSCEIVQSTDLP